MQYLLWQLEHIWKQYSHREILWIEEHLKKKKPKGRNGNISSDTSHGFLQFSPQCNGRSIPGSINGTLHVENNSQFY